MNQSILFVDDDAALLDGVRRMLRPMRKEWDMFFAPSPQEAIEKFQTQCFDVVVSDMRMPLISGAQLLSSLKDSCPGAVRFILSGQAETDSIIQCVKHCHQYITKPSSSEYFRTRINRLGRLRLLLGDAGIKNYLTGVSALPLEAPLYEKLCAALQGPHPSFEDIKVVLDASPCLSLKLLQLVHSSFFGNRIETCDPMRAVDLIGAELLSTLVQDGSIVYPVESVAETKALKEIVANQQFVTSIVETLARLEGWDQDVSQLVILASKLSSVGRALLTISSPEYLTNDFKVESNFEEIYPIAAAYLVTLWGLPEELSELIAYSLQPEAYDGEHKEQFQVLSTAIELGRCLRRVGIDSQNKEK